LPQQPSLPAQLPDVTAVPRNQIVRLVQQDVLFVDQALRQRPRAEFACVITVDHLSMPNLHT